MASLFSFWSTQASVRGLDQHAEVTRMLYGKLDLLARQLNTVYNNFDGLDEDDYSELAEETSL